MGNEEEVLCYYRKKLDKELDQEKLLLIFRKLKVVRVTPKLLQKTGILDPLRTLRGRDGDVGIEAQKLVASWKAVLNGSVTSASTSDSRSSHQSSHRVSVNGSSSSNKSRKVADGSVGHSILFSAKPVVPKSEPVRVKVEPVNIKSEKVSIKSEKVSIKSEPINIKSEPISIKSEPENDLNLSDNYDWSPPPPTQEAGLADTWRSEQPDAGGVRVKVEKDDGSWESAIGGLDNGVLARVVSGKTDRRQVDRDTKQKHVEHSKKDRSSHHHGEKRSEDKKKERSRKSERKKERSRESENGQVVAVKKEKTDHHHNNQSKDDEHKSKKRSHDAPLENPGSVKKNKTIVKSEHCPVSEEKNSSHGERRSKTEDSRGKTSAISEGKSGDSSTSTTVSKKTTKKATKRASEDGFNATMVSFEDCLGLNDVSSRSATKKKKVNTSPPPSTSTSTTSPSKSSSKSSASSSKKRSELAVKPPSKAVASKLKPFDLFKTEAGSSSPSSCSPPVLNLPDILTRSVGEPPSHASIFSTLPEIQPNYKPIRYSIFDNSPKKSKEIQGDSASFGRSTERTQVFSGRRAAPTVLRITSLVECCVKVLKENPYVMQRPFSANLDFPPYFLLKPALEKCSPTLLESIENLNDYLLEDSDELWQLHCNREFKAHEPDEMETWRELYSKLGLEREVKFKRITAIISQAQAKKAPERKAIMAFVEGSAKPPRNVARQQARFGTAGPPPRDDRSKMSATAKANLSKVGKTGTAFSNATSTSGITVSVPASSEAGPSGHFRRGADTGGADQKAGKKVAPLMQKTLKFMKNRFRR